MNLSNDKIKEILLDEDYLTEEDFQSVEIYAIEHGVDLEEALFATAKISKDVFGQAMAEHYDISYADFKNIKVDEEILKKIPESVSRNRGVVAFAQNEKFVSVGITNPEDFEIKKSLEKKLGQKIKFFYITQRDLNSVLSFYKFSLSDEFSVLTKEFKVNLNKNIQEDLVVKMVDLLLQYAYENTASDVHIEPEEKETLVRFRVDGVLHDVLTLENNLGELIVARIKILSKIRTDEHRAAQDGKLVLSFTDESVDVRVSVVPVTHGEKAVLRVLSSKNKHFNLSDLGLEGKDLEKIKKSINYPHGMILVTGPTGSGKTTSLYAVLKILNRREVNITTIEDPVEYDIQGVSQIQVNTKTDLTFAKGLRAIVRQDPDIIMIGEIRDSETAGIAVNSALTGHLVLSTLHTNDAATSLLRLLDMDIEPFLVSSTVNIIIAQRLVRKICEKCRYSYKPNSEEKVIIENNKHLKDILGKTKLSSLNFYKGKGCKVCNNTGYKGRIGIFEVMEMSEKIKEAVLKRVSNVEIQKIATEQGMTTMLEDGLNKVLTGITTLEEVLSVTL